MCGFDKDLINLHQKGPSTIISPGNTASAIQAALRTTKLDNKIKRNAHTLIEGIYYLTF